jgi:alpha-L-arabinofuranosidase
MEKEQTIQQILEMLKAMEEKVDADRIADREYMKQMMARTDENQEKIKTKMDANQAKAAKQEEMLAEISAIMDTNTK